MPTENLQGTINGSLKWTNSNNPMPGFEVAIYDKDHKEGWLGAAKTNAEGLFSINLNGRLFDYVSQASTIILKVFYGKKLISEQEVILNLDQETEIRIEEDDFDSLIADETLELPQLPAFTLIRGAVRSESGLPVHGEVRVFETSFRDKNLLSTANTDAAGRYELKVAAKNMNQLRGAAVQSIRVEVVIDEEVVAVSQELFAWDKVTEVNLVVTDDIPNLVPRFNKIKDVLTKVLDRASLEDVKLDGDRRDLKYLAESTQYGEQELEQYVLANNYAAEAGTDPDLTYALMQQGTTHRHPAIDTKWYEIEAVINEAVSKKVIYPPEQAAVIAFIETAKEMQVEATRRVTLKDDTVTVNDMLQRIFTKETEITDFLRQYNEMAPEGITRFWDAYEAENGAAKRGEVQRGLRLAAITGLQPEMTASLLQATAQSNAISTLASWDEPAWLSLISSVCTAAQKLCVPAAIRGTETNPQNEAVKTSYAKKLKSIVQHLYPLAAINSKLRGSNASDLVEDQAHRQDMITFIELNPEFDLRTNTVDEIENFNTAGVADVVQLKETLAPFQRLLRITGGYPDMVAALKADGIESGKAIAEMNKEAFIDRYAADIDSPYAAANVYANAVLFGTVAASTLTALLTPVKGGLPVSVMPYPYPYPVGPGGSIDVDPDLANLFGSMDYCACQDCISLYSPAAYFTDILHFLQQHQPAAFEELVRRRPDLKHIDLTCKNTNTVVPYIDLVNELLETIILKKNYSATGIASFQTSGSSKELAAHPEHVVKNASGAYTDYTLVSEVYDAVLKNEIYPAALPFDLAVEETRVYLAHLGTSRAALMNLFRKDGATAPGAITSFQLYCERLKITERAGRIITGTDTESSRPWKFYGFAAASFTGFPDPADSSAVISGDWDIVLANRLDLLLQQAQVSYKEMLQLLTTDFLNKAVAGVRPVSIVAKSGAPVDTCVVKDLQLRFTGTNPGNLRYIFFTKLYRFVRLLRADTYTIHEWDVLFRSMGILNLTEQDFRDIGQVLDLSEKTNTPPNYLAAWWHNLDSHQYINYNSELQESLPSVYDLIFRNKAVLNAPLDAFEINEATGEFGVSYADATAVIAAACGMAETDLLLLLQVLVGPSDEDLSVPVTLNVLSRVYAVAKVSKGLGLSVAQLMTLLDLLGEAIDTGTSPVLSANLEQLGRIVDKHTAIRASGFTIAELDYLLRNNDPGEKRSPDKQAIQLFYENLRAALQKMEILDLAETETEPGDEEVPEDPRLTLVKKEFARQFNMPFSWISRLVGTAFLESLTGSEFVESTEGISQHQALENMAGPMPEPLLQQCYDSYRLLHKVRLVADRLRLRTDDFNQLYDFASHTGFAFDTGFLPVGVQISSLLGEEYEGQPAIAASYSPLQLSGLLHISRWMQVRDRLALTEADVRTFLNNPTKSEWLELLKYATHWEDEIEALAGSEAAGGLLEITDPPSPGNYEDISLILKMDGIVAMCRQIGITASKLKKVLQADVTLNDAHQVLLAAKGKYDNDTWLNLAKPMRDVLRRKQRDALVAYVLANPKYEAGQYWQNENDLFAWLLIDVEVQSCMKTSRLKQAISSVQLFADRLLLGLESTEEGTPLHFSPSYAAQWEHWRKWYRIWEANRKIFLYPENWIEPELRDDKSIFFEELETELLQDDLNDGLAQEAIRNYLVKLEEVARLEPVSTCDEVIDNGPDEPKRYITHAFARTYAEPHRYFYRRLENDVWTPWERVELDIKSDHIAPVVWNNKLYLFWLTFVPKTTKVQHPLYYWHSRYVDNAMNFEEREDGCIVPQIEVTLNWSCYENSRWIKQKISKSKIKLDLICLDYFHTLRSNLLLDGYNKYHFKFINNFSKLSVSDLVKSRVYFDLALIDNEVEARVLMDYQMYSMAENNTYIEGFRFKAPSGEPLLTSWRVKTYRNILSPTGTVLMGMKFVEFNVDTDQPLKADRYGSGEAVHYIYATESDDTVGGQLYRVGADTILRSTAPMGVFRLRSKAGFAENPLENQFFFEDDRNTFFVRKIPSSYVFKNPELTVSPPALSTLFTAHPGLYAHSISLPGPMDPSVLQPVGTPIGIEADIERIPAFQYYFQTFYHPQAREYVKQVNTNGLRGLLQLSQQEQTDSMDFYGNYQPTAFVYPEYPENKVDFSYFGAYASYNWELFFHVPMLIAQRLSDNQQFAEARKWYHYIFDPTSAVDKDGATSNEKKRFWKFRPFYDKAQETIVTLSDILQLINAGNISALAQVDEWEENPFKPHVIARMRMLAYMKNVVMKYIDNLIAWGDQLFARNTIESINEATQLYILAANILGKKPVEVPKRAKAAPKAYSDIAGSLDAFSNALVEIETFIDPNASPFSATGSSSIALPVPKMFYFCLTQNDKLLGYWRTVADRLFKIRNCMNLSGQVQQLPLFEPPIDPALLVKAAAAGIDLGSVMADMTASPSNYRFSYTLQKAHEFCNEVRGLGNALLSALEKKDAEQLALLRSGQELTLLEKIRLVKQAQLEEATASLEALQQSRQVVEQRYQYYSTRPYMNEKEKEAMRNIQAAAVMQAKAGSKATTASVLNAIPNINLQGIASGSTFGGNNLGPAMQAVSNELNVQAAILNAQGTMAATVAGYERRRDDWQFQAQNAQKELEQLDKQLIAAEIRVAIAEKELANQERQIENARETDDYMRSKFTNVALYQWMIGQISTTYFQAYQMAFDLARKAEKCFKYELPLADAPTEGWIRFGYWDSLRKGLLAGEKLQTDLRRMEVAYMESNKRELELTKNVSLALFDPEKILALRTDGKCDFTLPSALFDLDFPGHYLRRIKSVSISIPCIAGPYTAIAATLSLGANKVYNFDGSLITTPQSYEAIAASGAQNDSGVFELNFRDERYLPFEGKGVVNSHWSLELMKDAALRSFDFSTISDVVLHVKYTALDDSNKAIATVSDLNAKLASSTFSDSLELRRYFSLKHEFSNEWFAYTHAFVADSSAMLPVAFQQAQFPFFAREKSIQLQELRVYLHPKTMLEPGLKFQVYNATGALLGTTLIDSDNGKGISPVAIGAMVVPATLKFKLVNADDVPKNMDVLLDDCWLVADYTLAS